MLSSDILNVISRYCTNEETVNLLSTCKTYRKTKKSVYLWQIEEFDEEVYNNFLFASIHISDPKDALKLSNKTKKIFYRNENKRLKLKFAPEILVLYLFSYPITKGCIPEGVKELDLRGDGIVKKGALPRSLEVLKCRFGVTLEDDYPKNLKHFEYDDDFSPSQSEKLPKTLKKLYVDTSDPLEVPKGVEELRLAHSSVINKSFIPETVTTLILDGALDGRAKYIPKSVKTIIFKDSSESRKFKKVVELPEIETLIMSPSITEAMLIIPDTVKYIEMGETLFKYLKTPKNATVIVK